MRGCQTFYKDEKLDSFGDVQWWRCGRDVVPNTDCCAKHLAELIAQRRGRLIATEEALPSWRAELVQLEEALEAHEYAASKP